MRNDREANDRERAQGPTREDGAEGVSRRKFLKIAGVAGASLGLGAGLGGVVGACGSGATTTTTAASTTTSAAVTDTTAAATDTTTAPGSTTSVSAAVETGRELKIGYVTPSTGGLASFAVPDKYFVKRATEAIGDGFVCGDGMKHAITFKVADTQSDTARAAQVAGDLITNEKVDVLLAASTPDTCVPAADQAEALGVPCLTCNCPWQGYVGGRTGGNYAAVFKWTYHVWFGAEDTIVVALDAINQVPTNKVLGLMFANDADGNAVHDPQKAGFGAAGYTVVDGSGFQDGTEDFTAQISMFKKPGAEVGAGMLNPPDFTTFWKQAIQQGWIPKVAHYGKALLFPQSVEALGSIANGLTCEQSWGPNWPFTSPLLGETCQQFADKFEASENQQWTQPLAAFMLFDWAIDVVKRTTSVDDKQAIMAAVKSTKMETFAGPIDFTAPVEPAGPPWATGPGHVVENVYKTPVTTGQWRKATKYPFEIVTVANSMAPMIAVQDKVQLYTGA